MQAEFYRAAFDHLPEGNRISPTVPSLRPDKKKVAGWLDYVIDGDLHWGVEILREGSNMKEHAKRFEQGGKYREMIDRGDVKEWVLLDFRCKHKKVCARYEHMYHIVFNNDFSNFELKKAGEQPERYSLLGDKVAFFCLCS